MIFNLAVTKIWVCCLDYLFEWLSGHPVQRNIAYFGPAGLKKYRTYPIIENCLEVPASASEYLIVTEEKVEM
jgi:hypothetical protein